MNLPQSLLNFIGAIARQFHKPQPNAGGKPTNGNTTMSFSFTSIINALTTAGVSSSTIPSVVTALGSISGPSSQVTAKLNQLAINMNNPAVIQEIVTQIESTPGVPPAVLPLLEDLKKPGISPLEVTQVISAIEQAVANANSLTSWL